MNIKDKIPLRGVWNKAPATKWEEAYLAGNGIQGVMVYGDPMHETIIGNHCRLFLPQGNSHQLPEMAEHLPEVRELIRTQGYKEALKFYYQKAKQSGYPGLTMSDPYHPAFHLHIDMPVTNYQSYYKSINYQTGEIAVNFTEGTTDYQSKTFVSRSDDVIVYQLEANKGMIDCNVSLANYDNQGLDSKKQLSEEGITAHYRYVNGAGGYDVVIRLIAPDAICEQKLDKVRIRNTTKLLIIMKIFPYQDEKDSNMDSLTSVIGFDKTYQDLFQAHARIHQEMFDRVALNLTTDTQRQRNIESLLDEAKENSVLPQALIEKIYDAGRYMYLSSAGELTPNLQGIWTGTFHPAWSGDFTFDTNVQLSIAAALSSNLSEGLAGYFRLLKELLPGFRENAQKYYGCRGIMSSAHSSNTGKHIHWNEEWPLHFWTCGAGWLGHWFYQYYLFTGDKKFLAKEAVPYLEEVALFYEDFLIKDSDGTYRFTPSYSAENGCADNATQDIAVAKEVLQHLIASYHVLQIHSPKIDQWQEILDNLPGYQINADGALKEWSTAESEENFNHRHFSHLYPVFQSREFTEESEPVLWQASKVAFDKRLEAWLKSDEGDTTSTHGRMHAALCATQFHMPELVYDIFTMLTKYDCFYPSLMMSHYNNQEVFNVDGNGAFPQVIHEMLIDYHNQTLSLLGALPSQIDQGEIKGIRLANQLEVAHLEWELAEGKLRVHLLASGSDQNMAVKLPLYPNAKVTAFTGCKIEEKAGHISLNLHANEHTEIVFQLNNK
ncbi:glycosyl hydrolase family 95 catalytic domain-containing protein [Paraliobacillus zengyii]|uniref:glycosyl hydrolase family 95 catalytic domain-containing protein n=1 Tax=Paraliobacillus zengyii TaxID=2213194 RepID=UPI000DD2C6DD|nr:glycoside hydrolase N-terminal domain-containing protein [Paraliobacillus zengyii]